MPDEAPRSRAARVAAETALVRVVHHYGSRPEFVLMGGLMPEYLCVGGDLRHAGTTDVDVQVDLEIACGAVNVQRLERALRNAEFEPDTKRVWRWTSDSPGVPAVVKFELLADNAEVRSGEILVFKECDALGAVNLRGTGFASRDVVTRSLTARVGDLKTYGGDQRHWARRVSDGEARGSTGPAEDEGLVRHRLRSAAQ